MLEGVAALRAGDLARFRELLLEDPKLARKAQLILEASRLAHQQALRLLVKGGGNLNASWRGYRPLHALIQEKPRGDGSDPEPQRIRCLEWMLANGADPEQTGAWPPARAIIVAAFTGVEVFVDRLRATYDRLDPFAACALAEVAAVRRELRPNPDFVHARDEGGLTALQCCAGSRLGRQKPARQRRLREVARLLLDAGADPNVQTRSWGHEVDAAYFAIGAGHAELLQLLLERGADATAALPPAAWNGNEELLALVCRHGGNVKKATSEGRPLLNDLVRWGQVQPVFWMLQQGADPNRADDQGWTALHQAASRGNERMFRALLDAGADPKRRDRQGRDAAAIARSKGRKKLAALGGEA